MSKMHESNYPKGASSWIVDSGYTAHMTFDRSLFNTYETVSNTTAEMGYQGHHEGCRSWENYFETSL